MISAYVTLGLFIWATRATVAFPWRPVARIVLLVTVASVLGAFVAAAWPSLLGLFVSGVSYLALVGVLLAMFDRAIAVRALSLARRVRG
jgi:hypothetical protein